MIKNILRDPMWQSIGALIGVISIVVAVLLAGSGDGDEPAAGLRPAESGLATLTTASPQPSSSASVPAVSTSSLEPVVQPIWHEGKAVLAPGTGGLDLDSPPDDPTWDGYPSDIFISNKDQLTGSLTAKFLLTDGPATYDTCQKSGYGYRPINFFDLKGKVICVITSADRFGILVPTKVNSSEPSATFDVTVWRKAEDS